METDELFYAVTMMLAQEIDKVVKIEVQPHLFEPQHWDVRVIGIKKGKAVVLNKKFVRSLEGTLRIQE